MLNLDSRTIVVITAILGPVMALVLLSLRRNYPGSVKGLGWWATGTFMLFSGILLIAARGRISDFLSIPVGAFLLLAGQAVWIAGTEKFMGLPESVKALRAIVLSAFALFLGFYVVHDDYRIRVVVVSLTMSTLAIFHCQRILAGGKPSLAGRMLVVCLSANCCAWLARAANAASGAIGPDVLASSTLNIVLSAAQSVLAMLTLFGFVLIASERVRDVFEQLATRDSLTGAWMRRAWDLHAQSELERSRRHNRPLSLILMDLDHFKKINDTLGHAAGDQALVDFVNRVNALLRKQDSLGRIGGEEFVLLLPDTGADEAHVVAERIRVCIERESKSPAITVSIGVAELQTQESTVAEILSRADAAMYRAKSWGRNRVELA
jgi:diguanylate cyclase (GGDEF)-like protein